MRIPLLGALVISASVALATVVELPAATAADRTGRPPPNTDGTAVLNSPAPSLHVAGNRLVTAGGTPVVLRGVNRSGTEYMCVGGGLFDGPNDQASIDAIRSWHANAVRIPLNEDCWLAINGVPNWSSGDAYRRAIADYVRLLNDNGLVAILELHWSAPGTTLANAQSPMPDQDHSPAFWSQVASMFKDNGAVIFEPFNEPYPDGVLGSDAGWRCWRDGGTCDGIAYQVAGMQVLVDAIRATGASNVIALGGLAWSNYLDGWIANEPDDPLNNLAASWHTYDFASCSNVQCYDSTVASTAGSVPVITTEFGSTSCSADYLNTLMNWLDSHQTSYLAWAWDAWGSRYGDPNACQSSALIIDYTGAPTTYGGVIRSHYLALP